MTSLEPSSRRRLLRLAAHVAAGALAGYVLLHPFSVHLNNAFEGQGRDLPSVLRASFSPRHLHMALYFAAIGAAFGLAYGAYAYRLARLNDEVTRLSLTDALTSLWNRRYLQQRLDEEIDRSRRYGRSLAFIIGDVDHFKRFNDTHGHRAGDALLRLVADVLRAHARRPDFVARYGGEEFAIVLPETTRERAARLAERMRGAIGALRAPGSDGGRGAPMAMSFGVAELPADADDAAALVEAADRALYHAKRTGRNRVASAADLRDPGEVGAGSSPGEGSGRGPAT